MLFIKCANNNNIELYHERSYEWLSDIYVILKMEKQKDIAFLKIKRILNEFIQAKIDALKNTGQDLTSNTSIERFIFQGCEI